ncbi:MAG: PAS domain-containing protein [Chromatiales bacterium]|nr:PAS domain-containing protein [Chromatiales bacterium]
MTTAQGSPGLSPELQRTLEASGVGVYSFDAGTGEFLIDATCRRLFDIDPDLQLSPDVMASRIHPDDLQRYWAAAGESLKNGAFACDYRVVHRNGDVRFVSGRGHLQPGPPGSPPRLQGVCIDVTTQRALEIQLQATQARMQELADGVPGLFAYLDRTFTLRFLSAQYDLWYGHSRTRHLNQHISTVITAESWARRKPLYDRCLAGEVIQYEEARTMANGERRFYSVTYQPHRDATGQVLGILSLAMDITERRAIQEELARSNQDLEQFAYVASHDLKAPLRAIEILVEWLREDLAGFTGGEVQQNLGLLAQRTARLHRLLDDLLAYSRAGRKPGEVVAVDAKLLVEDLFVLLAPPETMRLRADDSLPVLNAHHAPLEQVLRNLINNAIKHHPTREGSVTVYAQDKGDEVLFAVEDDGAGIPAEFTEKVFQMFQTLKPRDEIEGSGMGLAIVKRIVEWQGGRIWFHGGPGGVGTVFKFTWKKVPREGANVGGGEVTHHGNEQNRANLAG